MNTKPFDILNVTELETVTGGQADPACDFLVGNVKTAIKESYAHDSHDYAAQRMNQFGPALSAVKQTCVQRRATTRDEPQPDGRAPR